MRRANRAWSSPWIGSGASSGRRFLSKSAPSGATSAAHGSSQVKSSFNQVKDRRQAPASSFNLDSLLTRRRGGSVEKNVGLFQVSHLSTPDGFRLAKDEAIEKGWRLLDAAAECEPGEETIILFDELSDVLCRVADLSDFVKSSHPDSAYAEAAGEAHLAIGTMVEQLNTNTKLFGALQRVVCDEKVRSKLDDETRTVADLFMADFEISGIHLEARERHQAVELHEQLLQLLSSFMQTAHQPVVIPNSYVPDSMRHCYPRYDDQHSLVNSLNYDNPNEEVREFAYKVYHHKSDSTEQLLSRLLSTRYELAKLLGYESYSERALSLMTIDRPSTVLTFLHALSRRLKPHADRDCERLREMKRADHAMRRCRSDELRPWDVPLYNARHRAEVCSLDHSHISEFFSLGDCMDGLNRLFQSLYGVAFAPVKCREGEVWCDDVIKLAVTDERRGHATMGYIYCDFHHREGKPQQDCHFTIRGGRRLRDGSYQLPVVVLMLNLAKPTQHRPCLLSPVTMGNLFHEMGHAMHSMLARTRYQHVTGTRCATDFAEVPSILMEYFVNDPRVLKSFARHHKTQQPISDELLETLRAANPVGTAFETQTQVYYAIMDQVFHGRFDGSTSTHDILTQIERDHACVAAVEHGAWHHRFAHFAAYGAKYHAYLVSRAIASRIWTSCFARDPFDRTTGDKYRREMLQHGGGKHPKKMYESMLGEEFNVDKLVDTLIDDLQVS